MCKCQSGELKTKFGHECHDTKWASHLGQRHTRTLLDGLYYWSQMWDEVKIYVKTCLVC